MRKFFVLIMMVMFMMPAVANAYFLYEEPSGLIIAQPGISSSTTASKSSIYGAGTWDEPIYMNGVEIETTEHGFFAEYVDLAIGSNEFVITQGDDSVTVTITRTSSSSSSSSTSTDYLANVSYYSTAKYGVVASENGTHRQLPDGDQNLLNALAVGTTVEVLGEYGDYYCLGDTTFVYKSIMDVYSGEMPVNAVESVTVTPLNDENCTEVNFKIDSNTYYEVEYEDGKIVLTLWYASGSAVPVYQDNPVFSSINIVSNSAENKVVYEFILKETAALNGHYVEFKTSGNDNYMIFGVKNLPYLNGSLEGATVVLDAGHGGSDPGALGAAGSWGLTEAQINLVITNYAKDYLLAQGATVISLRSDDTYYSLQSRLVSILEAKPDLAISIHTNSNATSLDYSSISGFNTYYTYEVGNDAKTLITKAVTNYMGLDYNAPILSNLALTRQEATSAILIEHGYMSNPDDYELMLTSDYQIAMGEAIGMAVEDYLLAVGLSGESPYEVSTFEEAIATDPNNLDITVFVDGELVIYDVQPEVVNDSTMVPLRATFEALNAVVNWDNDAKSITATSGDVMIYMEIDSDVMVISSISGASDAVESTLLSPPIVVDGRTLVPIRAISESFDCTVDWESDTRRVKITTIED